MKLVTFVHKGSERVGILENEKVFDTGFSSMNDLIESGDKPVCGREYDIEEVEILAPIPKPRQDIICLGINYSAHAEESERFKKEAFKVERRYTVYFSKRVNNAVPNKGLIFANEDMEEKLDYEVELAVVIGKEAKNVKKEDAFDYIFGYTIINDVSARDLQTNHKQWYLGKSLDSFTPMGPVIVTEDEFERPPVLKIKSSVNGEVRQNSTTDMLIKGIDEIIEELSQGITLLPGTIIATGTPAGVGMGMTPPTFLIKGDVVKCEIEKIGTLENVIA